MVLWYGLDLLDGRFEQRVDRVGRHLSQNPLQVAANNSVFNDLAHAGRSLLTLANCSAMPAVTAVMVRAVIRSS